MAHPEIASHYSFSMINLFNLMEVWDFEAFQVLMDRAQTSQVELVPSLLLGPDWDVREEPGSWHSLQQLVNRFEVTSIQSLTYGLSLNLTDDFASNPSWQRRFQMLSKLGDSLSCHLFVLGSPGQKKLVPAHGDPSAHQARFRDNCRAMAEWLAPRGILCLEHNTAAQGAEYVNSLTAIQAVVADLEACGCANVGINLDTKCLLQEFGDDLPIDALLADPLLTSRIRSIQVSFDFLNRSCGHAEQDVRQLAQFAAAQQIPISLEEFGLHPEQLDPFVSRWRALITGR